MKSCKSPAITILGVLVILALVACSSSSTPTPTSDEVVAASGTPSFLFVAQGTSGTLESVEGSPNAYLSTINDADPTVILFSDRSDRISSVTLPYPPATVLE